MVREARAFSAISVTARLAARIAYCVPMPRRRPAHSRRRMTTWFRYRQNAARLTKYTTPDSGIRPRVKSRNCSGTDSDRNSPRGNSTPNAFAGSSPTNTGIAQAATPSTKATAGLPVRALHNSPAAHNAAPTSQYPR